MIKTTLLEELIKLNKKELVSFHVPGHKNGSIYDRLLLNHFKDQLVNIDTTEIPGTDNLHHPKGAIKKAQEEASEILGSEETYFLVNGSTAGIYSMIMAVTQPGDKVIIGRNSHASVINGLILADCRPIYLYPEIDQQQGIALEITVKEVEEALLQNPDAKAVLITYPTYHGIACNLKKIAEIVHKYGKILIVDEAHGAHLGLSDKLPMPALACGADLVVQSTHKTLPAFTQSSMLHVQGNRVDRQKLRYMLRMHQSSSPSYILMASLEVAMAIYKGYGRELMEELLENIHKLRVRINQLEGIYLLGNGTLKQFSTFEYDYTKTWINLSKWGISGVDLEDELRESYSIQMELSNLYGCLGIATIGNVKKDFIRLGDALEKIISSRGETEGGYENPFYNPPIPQEGVSPKEALYRTKVVMELREAEGRISGSTIIPYPPGIPVLMAGEVINKEMIQYIKTITVAGIEVIGLKDDRKLLIEVIQ